MAKVNKTKTNRVWDRRPWPDKGDSQGELHRRVGEAISAWERVELELSLLFAKAVGGIDYTPARRAYCAVRTFEGRLEMLKAASEAYFDIQKYKYNIEEMVLSMKEIVQLGSQPGPRRNDIAHGFVGPFVGENHDFSRQSDEEYALYPSFASFRERSADHAPTYCMGSAALDFFTHQFFVLSTKIMLLYQKLPPLEKET